MPTRLTHAAIAFAISVVVYQLYVVLAVPFLDPGYVEVMASEANAEEPENRVLHIPHKYRDVLAQYFREGHWTLAKPSITFESERMLLVVEGYDFRETGEVHLSKCALIFFPTPRVRGESSPRDAVILEAAHGAVIQFDKAFRPGAGSLGTFEEGRLLGEIVIRSDMREPGSHDDLYLTTRDVRINRDLIRTEANVDLQLGPHRGHGRVMEIRLLDVERGDSFADGFSIGGLETLNILHDVRAELVPQDDDWLGQGKEGSPNAPIEIRSGGSFGFHFGHYKASFNDHVQVTQRSQTGELDQLHCEELSLFLSSTVKNRKGSPSKFRPGSVCAVGKNGSLVTLHAPSQEATARCERMWFEFAPRRITLDGSDEVTLTYRGSEIYAPLIRYQAPPADSPQKIGDILAAGNGRIRARTGDDPTAQPLEVRWTKELRLQRVEGRPVMTLRGRPRLEMIGMGQLWADEMEVYLRESTDNAAEVHVLPSEVVPQRVMAKGKIAFDSAELYGEVHFMDVLVNYAAPQNELAIPRQDSNPPWDGSRKASRRDKYRVDGNRLQMLLTVRERDPEITTIDVDGDVVFQKLRDDQNRHEEPLVVRADHMHVEDADAEDASVALIGKPAIVTASGTTIRAAKIRLNRGTSQAWIESPGELVMPVQRDLTGRRLTTPTMMQMQWQGGMELNRDRITIRQGVYVEAIDGWLKTEELTVLLTAPISFAESASSKGVEVAQIGCAGGAYAQFQQRDVHGLTSLQNVSLDETLTIDQRSGNIFGTGGGWIESVHLAKGNLLGGPVKSRPDPGQRLRFLHVDFVRGVEGNLQNRQIAVKGNVEAVYGPVDSWEKKLQRSVSGMPGAETLWISADKLGVASSPMRRVQSSSGIGPVELQAEGDVTIEGLIEQKGYFTTHSHVARYDQHKTMFVLQGRTGLPARLTLEEYVGAPPAEWVAENITYVHATQEVKATGVHGGSLRRFDANSRP